MMCLARMLLVAIVLLVCVGCETTGQHFDGERAFAHVEAQCEIGPRPAGSEAAIKTTEYIKRTLERSEWQVEFQEFAYQGQALRNVIAKKGEGPIILVGTHYDTRPLADRDPHDRSKPIMGANDGGSGTAVLLELGRVLDERATDQAEIWLVFFDAEDRGDLGNWKWCVGSTHLADELSQHEATRPEYVLIVDMIGDADQQIYYEWSSVLWLQEKIWGIAADLGYEQQFVPYHRHTIWDDHSPFLQRGIPAAVVIDFDYPYWHTRFDTLDKISVDSLQRMGDVLETLLEGEPFTASPIVEAGQ